MSAIDAKELLRQCVKKAKELADASFSPEVNYSQYQSMCVDFVEEIARLPL